MERQPDLKQLFGPIEPTELMKKFFQEHPEAKWNDALAFLLDSFPQVADGQVQYLIDGGTAVHLLHPEREEPLDVDIIVRSEEFKRNFVNARIVDPKTPKDWCSDHVIPYNEQIVEKIFALHVQIQFSGRTILIVCPEFLALSKSIPWRGKPQERAKEISDLKLLSVSTEMIQRLKETLGI